MIRRALGTRQRLLLLRFLFETGVRSGPSCFEFVPGQMAPVAGVTKELVNLPNIMRER